MEKSKLLNQYGNWAKIKIFNDELFFYIKYLIIDLDITGPYLGGFEWFDQTPLFG